MLLPVPTVPAQLAKTKAAKRSHVGIFTGKERSEKSDEAQKLRKEAQSQTPSQAFFDNLGQNITQLQGSDKRRWEKAYFHLKLHQAVLAMTAHTDMLTRIIELLQTAVVNWEYLPRRQQTRLQNGKGTIKTHAETAYKAYTQVYDDYAKQLKAGKDSKDQYQAVRILNAYSDVTKALIQIIDIIEAIGTSTGQSRIKS